MALERLFTQTLLRPADLTASRPDLRVIGAFNPGAIRCGDETIVLVRVAESPTVERAGHHALPHWTPDGELAIEWLPDEDDVLKDPRKVIRRGDELMRLKFVSHIRVYRSRDGRTVDEEIARIAPSTPYESFGVEDPRVTWLDGRYWITYVSVSEHGAGTSLISTEDFRQFERHGMIFCPENKDVVLFPEKIGGRWAAMHRPNTFQRFCKPQMWLAYSDDRVHWGEHAFQFSGQRDWDADRIGAGPPPVRIDEGWLAIYHGSRRATRKGEVGAYSCGALLLDADDPSTVLAATPEPFIEPQTPEETAGFVPNVCFVTGIVDHGDAWWLYYGASDTTTAVAGCGKQDLLDTLEWV